MSDFSSKKTRKNTIKSIKKFMKSIKHDNNEEGLSNIRRMLKVTYNSVWYDFDSILSLIQKQLEYMIENWVKNTHYVKAKKHKIQMIKTHKYIKRMRNDYHMKKAFKEIEKKYGKTDFKIDDCTDSSDLEAIEIYKKNGKTYKISKKDKKDIVKIYKKWGEIYQKDKKKLLKLLSNFDEWWD